jgi:cbb3-type cytochrome oxidase maturation protein
MEVLPLLIVISLVLLVLAVWLFFRMSDSGQFDDVEGPARRILMDDDRPAGPTESLNEKDRQIKQ